MATNSTTLKAMFVFNKSNPIVVAVRVLDGTLLKGMEVKCGAKNLGIIENIEDSKQKPVEQGVVGETYAIQIVSKEKGSAAPSLTQLDTLAPLVGTSPMSAPQRPSTHTWCSATEDHKHIAGEPRVVGQSWHGPVHFWECTKCGYQFGDH